MGVSKRYMKPISKQVTGEDLQLGSALVPSPTQEQNDHTYHPTAQISQEEQDQMMREWAANGNLSVVEAKWGVHQGYLRSAMRRRYGSLEAMKTALLGLVTENALTSQVIAAHKMPELTGAQAVFAGKLLVETMVNIEKSIASAPKTIDFGQLKRVGDSIRTLREIVGKPVQV